MHQASLELLDFLYASASTMAKDYNCLHFEKEAGVTRGETGTEDLWPESRTPGPALDQAAQDSGLEP